MGSQGGRLKAVSQKLSYTLHNLTPMNAFSLTVRKHELRERPGKMQREFSFMEALTPPSPLKPWNTDAGK